jgi:peptide subunit release factor 1 (eRF1)
MAASKESLETLHSAIATKLTDAIEKMDAGEKGLAALLNVARQFVKDNGIEAVPAPNSPLGTLADKLKDYPFEPSNYN